ncbi:hypothetical protein [Chryseobacterium indologenes]|uniref:Uncharacterized protein n=1 Tax=Chryseobacterium indologenes TaxID=253 RepID=A0A0N1KQS6_CHRID|nr:hypothetical protein [Chryseobacterium indologenes]KPE49095.1 hypothetical protein AOB46_21880 [Chryseobacterium indologenes]
MKNIWFTIYVASKDVEKFNGLANYRTLLEFLLISAVQDKLDRTKKVNKIMFCLIPDLEEDSIDNFIKNYFNGRKPALGIINLEASTKGIDWNDLSDKKKKALLIDKWKVLFSNLSDDYFLIDKSEVLQSLEALKTIEWTLSSSIFKKKLRYKKEIYEIIMNLSVEKATLTMVRLSDQKSFKLKEYDTWKIMTEANFKNFNILEGDILRLENSSIFGSPQFFDLKDLVQ